VRVLSVVQAMSLQGVANEHARSAELFESGFTERLRRGELDALAWAYDEHHPAVCSFAKRLLGDEQAAEDLVQEVFVVLPDVVHRLTPEASLRAFLLGIAANRARHHVRSRSRRQRLAARLELEPPREVENPEQLSERRHLADLLARALETLPLDQRTTFVLKEIEGYSAKEAGDILAVPEATVRTRLFHARHRLRAFLEGGAR
jgi:RNA polymerase sigma-70 factor, ECF subfamily